MAIKSNGTTSKSVPETDKNISICQSNSYFSKGYRERSLAFYNKNGYQNVVTLPAFYSSRVTWCDELELFAPFFFKSKMTTSKLILQKLLEQPLYMKSPYFLDLFVIVEYTTLFCGQRK